MLLDTERLRIRQLTVADLDAVAAVLDPGPVGGGPVDPDRRRRRIEWLEWQVRAYHALEDLLQPPYGDWGVVLRDQPTELVGVVGYSPCLMPFGQLPWFSTRLWRPVERRHTAEVGLHWSLHPDHRGRGYATEAGRALIDHGFGPMELARIVATTTYDNAASVAVMERLGMTVERNPFPEPFWFQLVGILEP